jgi:hypothetical protein
MEGSNAVTWRKSSYSGSNGGQCVEVAASGRVLVRDTTDSAGALLADTPLASREDAARIRNCNEG